MKAKINNIVSTTVLTFIAVILFGAKTITAAPGDLDPTFGTRGIAVTPITDAANLYAAPYAIKVQPDVKIVVWGPTNSINKEHPFMVIIVSNELVKIFHKMRGFRSVFRVTSRNM